MEAIEENIHSSEPATKGDVEQLREDLQSDIVKLEVRVDEFEQRMDDRFDELKRHFDAVIEIITDQLTGAHRDEIAELQRNDKAQQRRLTRLERQTGLAS